MRLFGGFGIEIEYMIVDRATLAVRPVADRLLHAASGTFDNEAGRGALAWSNELALHVVEFKTAGPVRSLDRLDGAFAGSVADANRLLGPEDALLLGTGMHPLMRPADETRLWPHGCREIYEAFHRIFACNRHGWANLQSVHLNLPFTGDEEFGRLHAAIRLVLPLIPALAASSPLVEGELSEFADTRLETYRTNAAIVPSITGEVIPEPVFTEEEYRDRILDPIYRDLAPFDPEGVLADEWVNARGAIARFDRGTIEIRLIDAQETPAADLAIAAAVAAAVKLLVDERTIGCGEQRAFETGRLAALLAGTVRHGERAVVGDEGYLAAFGVADRGTAVTAGGLWKRIIDRAGRHEEALVASHRPVLEATIEQGTLSTRIVRSLCGDGSPERIRSVYRRLAACLRDGALFLP